MIQRDTPTLMVDEVDTIYSRKRGADANEGLRALLNAGYERAATVHRCVGPNFTLADFPVFCPKALAGIGKLPDTVADRCLTITMRRKPREKVRRFFSRDVKPLAQPLAAKLEALSQNQHIIATLQEARPVIPPGFDDRAADISHPLLAIADMAGDKWPLVTRTALAGICAVRSEEDESAVILLLRGIREIFAQKEMSQIPTQLLLEALIDRESEPWADWWEADIKKNNTQGVASKLARMLKPFGIIPGNLREHDGTVIKGYKLISFEEVFSTYAT